MGLYEWHDDLFDVLKGPLVESARAPETNARACGRIAGLRRYARKDGNRAPAVVYDKDGFRSSHSRRSV
jgi:hypothetical protein